MERLPGAIFQQDSTLSPLYYYPSLPARYPNLSPIEHIWNHLGWRIGHLTSLNELEVRLQQIWNEMSQDIMQNLCASLPDCIASCIRARGGFIGY
ncbi:transposable element Tcb1 transposase [Trichonephila clavipes]|uniref:Transposable element Tcb1 transposase n=1 Tax=Trichonephila clavipes TaxID=2585209 RepID=A0A8X6VGA6_TRICX|nr:transposable element Tcb1 transposase [Trichonephila clavipes]